MGRQRSAAPGASNSAVLWDVSAVAAPRVLATLVGHRKEVVALAFSADGSTVAVGSWDHTVSLWNVTDPAYPRPARHN